MCYFSLICLFPSNFILQNHITGDIVLTRKNHLCGGCDRSISVSMGSVFRSEVKSSEFIVASWPLGLEQQKNRSLPRPYLNHINSNFPSPMLRAERQGSVQQVLVLILLPLQYIDLPFPPGIVGLTSMQEPSQFFSSLLIPIELFADILFWISIQFYITY